MIIKLSDATNPKQQNSTTALGESSWARASRAERVETIEIAVIVIPNFRRKMRWVCTL